MLHPSTELRTIDPTIGQGVFATRDIPRGTIVWIRDDLDRAYTQEEVAEFKGMLHDSLLKYSFVAGDGCLILCWDLAKYVNHSCEANMLSTPWGFEITIRDVAAGEQLTDDYGSLNLEEPLTCLCGSAACRGTIQHDDPERLASRWDELVRAALPAVLEVEQPLWALVSNPDEVEAAARDPESLPSVLANYVPAGPAPV